MFVHTAWAEECNASPMLLTIVWNVERRIPLRQERTAEPVECRLREEAASASWRSAREGDAVSLFLEK